MSTVIPSTRESTSDAQSTTHAHTQGAVSEENEITCLRETLALRPSGHPNRASSLNNLANALLTRFKQSGVVEDLDAAIMHHRASLDLRPSGHPYRGLSLNNLALALQTRFEQSGGIGLDASIMHHHDALALRPSGHPNRASSLNKLAFALQTRFMQSGVVEDIDAAIMHRRAALDLRPSGHPNRGDSLNNLAVALQIRFGQSRGIEDLDAAIVHHHDALALRPSGRPRAYSLNKLPIAFQTRFEQSGVVEDLDAAIMHHRAALDLRPSGHPKRTYSLNDLAVALLTRFIQSGVVEDLHVAIMHLRAALDLRPSGHPKRRDSLDNLASALQIRFKQSGVVEDLDAAIMHHRAALDLRPSGHPYRGLSLNNLALALQTRFKRSGLVEDLDAAIMHHRVTLDLRPSGHPNRGSSLNNLAGDLQTRFEQSGGVEDLDAAIMHHRDALALRPSGHPDRGDSLNNLAVALHTRFEQSRDIEDLNAAIMHHCDALVLCPSGHPGRAGFLTNFANTLLNRFQQFGGMVDLDTAVLHHREALALRPFGHPERGDSLNNLALALHTRFKQSGDIEDLNGAIVSYHDALALYPLGHPHRTKSLRNLANALLTRFQQFRGSEDLDAAIMHHRAALDLRPSGHPFRGDSLNDLAIALQTRFDKFADRDNLDESFVLFEHAAMDSFSSSMTRFKAAQEWAYAAKSHQHSSTIHAYSEALTLLHRCLLATPTADLQHQLLLSHTTSLASDAAYCAVEARQLQTAVELLDHGRAILWSRMRGYRFPLEILRQANADLAERFQSLSTQLENLATSSAFESIASDSASPRPSVSFDAKIALLHAIVPKFDEVVDEIRREPGFKDFLQAVPFTTLRTAAEEGPVIIVNISVYGSHAIILYHNVPVLVPLSEATPDALRDLASDLYAALACSNIHRSNIIPVLQDLWRCVVHPVTDQLQELGVAEKTRIWWCPTSILCTLPIHAAGPYSPGKRNLTDMYISSYTPTLSALIRARADVTSGPAVPRLLAIGQTYQGQSGKALPRVQHELDYVGQLGIPTTVLSNEEASSATVRSKLQDHSWAHFACHGRPDVDKPFQSSFELQDNQRLTLLELIQARMPNAELAFLSACHSAAGDKRTPDESIHLAAALQFCGFRSTVGTLWAMADDDGPLAVEEFYKYMFGRRNKPDFKDAASALNEATRAMRKKKVPVHRWISFVHIGA